MMNSNAGSEIKRRLDMKRIKKTASFLLAVVLIIGFIPLQTQAASKKYMKKINVSWDLKNNKTVTFKTNYAGVGMRKMKAKITDYKITDAQKTGYKKLTYVIRFEMGQKNKPKEIHKICNSKHFKKNNNVSGLLNTYVIDYDTGKNLTSANPYDVTCTFRWTTLNTRKEEDGDGCFLYSYRQQIASTVIYPQNYKGLCIGFGGGTKLTAKKNDTHFRNGKAVFGQTSFFSKKDKTIAHFMRVK